MSNTTWSRKEIDLYIEEALSQVDSKEDIEEDIDYIEAICESALRAIESLQKDGHSGSSIQLTKNILMRLIDYKPLTPITDLDFEWYLISKEKGMLDYQARRYSALFKRVYPDGKIEYSDFNRVQCVDIAEPGVAFHNKEATEIVDEKYPIVLPYLPGDKPYTVYRHVFKYDKERNGDYDTVAYTYLTNPEGHNIPIYRYYKEVNEEGKNRFVRINEDEFYERHHNASCK